MGKDPAFLFYDGDAARDVSHMNRLERGAYFDLIQAQRKFDGYTVEQARKILGKDFDSVWEALTLVLKNENGCFFIEWVRDSVLKRKEHAEKQRLRIQNYWDKKKKVKNTEPIPRYYRGNTLENENANEDENENVLTLKNKRSSREKTFEIFWQAYPNKSDKKRCLALWQKIDFEKNPFPMILENLEALKASWGWTKDGGQFIPMAKTWLNREGWHDTIKEKPPEKESIFI